MHIQMHIQIETELLPQKPGVTQGKALRGSPNPVGFSLPDAHQIRMVPGGPQYIQQYMRDTVVREKN